MSNLDRKIIEHEGVKYYKKGGQWYQMFPIGEDNVPADIKTKKSKLNLQPEIQLDVLKCLTFIQLLSFQQTSFYFKNFIDTFEKQLARKKYDKLEMIIPSQLHYYLDRYKDYEPYPKLYRLKLDEHGYYGFCERNHEFIKLDPQLYDFNLSEQLEEKWKAGIQNSIPMFLSVFDDYDYPSIDTIFCGLQHDYKVDKGYLLFEVME